MRHFRQTEILFLLLGAAIMFVAFILLQSDLMVFMRSQPIWSDPFAAKYAPIRVTAAPLPTMAPPAQPQISTEELFKKELSKIELKKNLYAKATPAPAISPSRTRRAYEKEKVYLLQPINQAILGGLGNPTKGYTVHFHFEAVPKDTPCTLEVLYRGRTVYSKEQPLNENGNYQVAVKLSKPGLYQWRVKSTVFRGKPRDFTIR